MPQNDHRSPGGEGALETGADEAGEGWTVLHGVEWLESKSTSRVVVSVLSGGMMRAGVGRRMVDRDTLKRGGEEGGVWEDRR